MIGQLNAHEEIPNGYIHAIRKVYKGDYIQHFHNFFELEYIVSGTGKYIIDNNSYDITPGMVFFTTPASFHQLSDADIVLYTIMFEMNACNQHLLQTLFANSSYQVTLGTEKSRIFYEAALDELVNNISNKTVAICMLDSVLAKISVESHIYSPQSSSVTNQARLFILSRFHSELTLEDVANHVGLTPTYLSQIFKKETGVTFKKYVNNLRFECARNLLEHSDMNVLQICTECGFNDYSNFIRRFKAHFGISPSQYKKAMLLTTSISLNNDGIMENYDRKTAID